MKKIIIIIVLFLVIAVIYMLFSIKTKEIKRPNSVPVTAVWDGGADGGNWIDCKVVDSTNNIFYCTVFDDYSGEIIFQSTMKLKGKNTKLVELNNLLGVYSGDEIYLKDNRKLKEINIEDSLSFEEKVKLSPDK